jgi:sarcosine oxidase subunit alpha
MIGRITSVVHSPTLGHGLGLAFLNPSHAETGKTFSIRTDSGALVEATVVETPFYDPKNERQKC